MQITFDRRTVNTCLQQKFVLPSYQRDYKWEAKHLRELLTDVQESFLASWEPAHGRKDILGYDQYFLGTIITTQVAQGGKAIIDGQQRITTLTLLLAYIHRESRKKPELNISPVDQSIRRRVAGQNEFNLDMEVSREHLFSLLLDGPLDDDELGASIDSITDRTAGTNRLWGLYQEIGDSLAAEITSEGLLPHLFDYITECVCVFEIGVPREQDGHKVFVTMNDRGLKLGPIDLLKGFLLSSIPSNDENRVAHESWNSCLKKLLSLGNDEDSNFFKTWVRAKYATTMRGKKRGDNVGDFELIGDSYHRWVIDNRERFGLRTSDDFSNFMSGTLPYFVDLYCRIKRAERETQEGLSHVFYNGARDFTTQAMVIMSAVKESDSGSDVSKKVRAISYYLDYLATVRVVNGKENTYDNIRDVVFDLCKEVRNLSLTDLRRVLIARINGDKDDISNISEVRYYGIKRQDLLHLLARIADYLELEIGLSNRVGFAGYVDRSRDSRTFDVEHLLANSYTDSNIDINRFGGSPFASMSDFLRYRDSIGGLILLPRGRNRSMKDMPFSEKLRRYPGENVLAQTLTDGFFMNQPNWARFEQVTGVTCTSISSADAAAIEARTAFYRDIAKRIWSSDRLEEIFH